MDDNSLIFGSYKDNILIFGGSGCLGKKLIDRYINTYNIINFSRDEHKHWKIDKEMGFGKIKHVIGDAIDSISVKNTLIRYRPSKIFIIHALKHVDRCQENVHASINTNLLSIKNILDCIQSVYINIPEIKEVIFTSTDKAPSPINVYGMCKALCEELIIETSKYIKSIKFVIVRYGNVLNSTSSLIPSLLQNTGNTYYLTDERMTRFWMSIEDAINCIEYAINYGNSGEVIIPKVKSFYVKDIIEHIASIKNKNVEIMGMRPGERLYETLINDTQSLRTIEKDKYYHILPYYPDKLQKQFTYNSTTNIIDNKNELIKLFNNLINVN